MAGISSWEAIVLLLVVLLVVGPDKLPEITSQVAGWVRAAREFVSGVRDQVSEELGDVNLKDLDPREYDPRRIMRDALAEQSRPAAHRPPPAPSVGPAPFDDEAT